MSDRRGASTGSAGLRRPRRRARATFASVLGELLLTAGVLILLFIGWQLWYQDLLSRGEQETAAEELTEGWTDSELPYDGEIPVVGRPGHGEGFAIIHVPRFGDDYERPILGGTSSDVLAKGVGYYTDTARLGEVGNFAIAGHRTTYGSPFNGIADLRVGDAIVIETEEGWYTYLFRNREYVWPTGVGVLYPVPQDESADPTERIITLTSCNPMFSAAERIIAYGVFDSFTPRADGPPAALTAAEEA